MAETTAELALRKAVEGLTYQSETDAPWEVVRWPSANVPTADEVRAQGHHPKTVPVIEQTVEEFVSPLAEDQDWFGDEEKAVAAQYRSLLTVLKAQLTNAKVFKVGERKLTVYVVGQVKEGGLTGLKTTAVET
ncbi:MAG TPA: nuclease A inhibitor family protein [Urbifossiella sp.]|jgi:hypothetical protein|nr:nuclease A inhibitor family protein [Urbifossiella sp.]